MVERADAAAGDVGEDDRGPAVYQLVQLVDEVLVLVADAVAGDGGGEHAALGGEVRVHDVARAQVVGEDGRLAVSRVDAAREGQHAGRLARAEEAAGHHVLCFLHIFLLSHVPSGRAPLLDLV